MKAARKHEYEERRIRKNKAQEIFDRKKAEYEERNKDNKPEFVKVANGLWKEVKNTLK